MSQRRTFDSRFQTESEETLFMHHVDDDAKTLRVQVLLGCGLSNTFHHQPPPAEDGDRRKPTTLAKKTSGFLAAVTPSRRRIVLAWAESGHGMGRHGDGLGASPHVLGNAAWASRAMKLAAILGIDLASPFDKPTTTTVTPQGSFQASHVEAKLATHAAVLLHRLSSRQAGGADGTADSSSSSSSLTRESLARLGRLRWRDGSPLHFEVYVSRRNCHRCGAFLRRLQDLTGVRFDLVHGTRVVPIQYHQQQLKRAKELGLRRRRRSSAAERSRRGDATDKLQTFERDGVIHYVPPESSEEQPATLQTRVPDRIPLRVSPHHLSDIDKPLPATPVTEAPDFSSSDSLQLDTDSVPAQTSENFPFPPRSPRPYGMAL